MGEPGVDGPGVISTEAASQERPDDGPRRRRHPVAKTGHSRGDPRPSPHRSRRYRSGAIASRRSSCASRDRGAGGGTNRTFIGPVMAMFRADPSGVNRRRRRPMLVADGTAPPRRSGLFIPGEGPHNEKRGRRMPAPRGGCDRDSNQPPRTRHCSSTSSSGVTFWRIDRSPVAGSCSMNHSCRMVKSSCQRMSAMPSLS